MFNMIHVDPNPVCLKKSGQLEFNRKTQLIIRSNTADTFQDEYGQIRVDPNPTCPMMSHFNDFCLMI